MHRLYGLALAAGFALALSSQAAPSTNASLSQWRLQSSAGLTGKGDALSRAGYDDDAWYVVTVPNTVVGALVQNGHFEDPYFGMNLRSIPGTTYPIGERFTLLPTPDDSPFKPSWWYRTEVEIPSGLAGRSLALRFEGINYRANIWMNGTRLAAQDEIAGAFRRYDLDVTAVARPGERNAVAVEVFAPEPHDLAFMWVDWNPTPADKNMGLWGEVSLVDSGPIALKNPHVVTQLDLPSLDKARLTVTVEARNTTNRPVSGVVRGAIDAVQFAKRVSLGPGERSIVRFTPEDVPQLSVDKPRLWWPYRMGPQNLYTLVVDADVEGAVSDREEVRFGIVQHDSELTKEGHRRFKVNGKPILIRGGGWASDMLLRPASRERLEAELRYTREMGLNTIRLEGKLESNLFYDLADEYGILVMAGWCCCDQWELWDKWDEEDHRVGPASLRDQLLRIRNHPSVFVWLNGSDFPPVAKVEQAYLDVLKAVEWPKPILSNATDTPGPVSGPSGVKMRGPYDYIPPSYWLLDKKRGGAFGFATEVGPGAAVPPLDSLKQMLPEKSLWPMDDVWRFHAGGDEFKDIKLFTGALEGRYGKAADAADYARKAQALAYEGQRAMFEAFGRNKYTATGVIQWMLNNAWPSMIWHLYDWYLRPGGGYYGSKKACEPLHVQFSYDDRSVAIVNDLPEGFQGLKATAKVYDLKLVEKFSREARVDVGPDSVARAFTLPKIAGLTKTYFLRLDLEDAGGRPRSSNVYWLSTQEDVIDLGNTKYWWYTPTKAHADLKALTALPPTTLAVDARFEEAGREWKGHVTVENTGSALAFQTHLKAVDPTSGREILPVYWEDNYMALFPGEKRELRVALPRRTGDSRPEVSFEAWNVAAASARSGEK
ncbi:MAG TPA: glycoside hydrolase family 2 TIM barrel-domain containing protein [Vicinamibacteria bacterium]|nr:glycoside hydrolase family 2 TIM barrel-domain containing protein [Vicinamibacteria bacterium]